MYEGHVYLVAIMDWHTRAVLSWRVSTTMDVGFCVEAYREAVRVAGRAPDIMNTGQGSQFTCEDWIETVEESGARVSMDGKGRGMDKRKAAPGLHRTALAEPEIRRTALLELRDGGRSHRPNREVDGLLQPSA
jgi:transposase InsO family protein